MGEALSNTLKMLPNLSSIVYSPYPRLIPTEGRHLAGLLPRGVTGTRLGERYGGYASAGHPFLQLIRGLYWARHTGIKAFETMLPLRGFPSTHFSLSMFDMCEFDLIAAWTFFQNLEDIKLNMAFDASGLAERHFVDYDKLIMLSKMVYLLSAAKKIRHLTLYIIHWDHGKRLADGQVLQRFALFPYLGLGATWPRLQELSLGGIGGNSEDFVNLISRHKSTLKSVVMKECTIFKGVWATVVDEVLNSSIYPFVLDRVNDTVRAGYDWTYEGRLEIAANGDRVFVENPYKQSVYSCMKP